MKRKSRELPGFLRVPWGIPSALILFFAFLIAIPFSVAVYTEFFAPFSPALHWFSVGLRNNDIYANFLFAFLYSGLGMVAVWLFLRRYQAGWATVGWRKFNFWKMVMYVIAIFIIFMFLAVTTIWLIHLLIPAFDPNQVQENEFTTPTAAKHPWIVFASLVIFPPILEETVFRGYMFPAISKRLGLIGGAIVSSLLFAVAHGQFNVGIYTFLLGMILCFMYVKFKSIVPGVILHGVNNSLALLAVIHWH